MTGTEATDLLARRNPVSAAAYEELARRVQELRPTLPPIPEGSSRIRPRRRRLRVVVAAVIVILGALLVAPAMGLHVPALDFFRADQAPPRIVKQFSELSTGAPEGMDPNVIAGETRKVETVRFNGSQTTLWVAPTRFGGFCFDWAGGGGCDRLGTTPLGIIWAVDGPLPATAAGGLPSVRARDFGHISGHVNAQYVDRVQIRFADGTTVDPEITWVSPPINAGFFLYSFTAAQQRPGHEVQSVVALDSHGAVITEEAAPGTTATQTAPPPDAVVSKKTVAFTAPTAHGDAVIWQAPTRYDGTCAWLEYEGEAIPFAPCQPKGYDWNEGMSSTFHPTRDSVLFLGTAADRYPEIDMVYADGDVERITPHNHVFVAAIPDKHFAAGHQLARIEVRGSDGNVIPSASFEPAAASGACSQLVPTTAPGGCG